LLCRGQATACVICEAGVVARRSDLILMDIQQSILIIAVISGALNRQELESASGKLR
jgi:hypothetical protein